MNIRRITAGWLALWLLLVAALPTAAAGGTDPGESTARAIAALNQQYQAKKAAALDDWTLIGLALSGESLRSAKWGNTDWQSELATRLGKLDERKTTDYARFTLTLLAMGLDPSQFGGVNLIQKLKQAQLPNGKFADSIDGQGQSLINAHDWSIIALYAAGEQVPKAKLATSWLKARQLPDGGFQYATDGKEGGVDMTAMSLLAMKALGLEKTDESVAKAFAFLRQAQTASGGFAEGGVDNAESAANVICALIAWGEDPRTWGAAQVPLVDHLLSFQKADGMFSHTRGGSGNRIATAQSLLALADLSSGSSYLTRLREAAGVRKLARLHDLSPAYWAYPEFSYLVKNGYLQGVSADSMQPEAPVTRAQFAALLLRAIGEEPNARAQGVFADVPARDWSAPVAEKAAALRLMQGSGKQFRPNDRITQEEAATIAFRVAQRYGWTKTYAAEGVDVAWDTVSTWAKDGVKDLQARHLLGGTADKTFRPKAAMTRAEAAVLLYRLLQTR